jgi:mono/diheme cytochrome c family protein
MCSRLDIFVVPAVLLIGGFGVTGTLRAQSKTVLDGVYTASQAMRGDALYVANCAKCHEGADVDGPPLKGDPFIDRWREDRLTSLFTFIKTGMPRDAPGKLSEGGYLDIVAYLLQANTYPPGSGDLTARAIESTQLVGKDGSKPLPTNATVRVAGCFTAGAGNTWTLTTASDPVRTREADQTNADELKSSASTAAGTRSFRLQNLDDLRPGFSPEPYKEHKVQVKGVLIRQTNNDRINVTSLETVAAACSQ